MADTPSEGQGVLARARGVSVSLMNANPQLGMWQASGLAIAQAPNLRELRDPEAGGDKIEFNAQGHSMRTAVEDADGELTLVKSQSIAQTLQQPTTTAKRREETGESEILHESEITEEGHHHHQHDHHLHFREKRRQRRALRDKHKSDTKEDWKSTINNGFKALWKFVKTPSGFVITIYFLNIVVRTKLYLHTIFNVLTFLGVGCNVILSHTQSSSNHEPSG